MKKILKGAAPFVVLLLFLFLLAVNRVEAQELSLEVGPTVNNVENGTTLWLDARWLGAGPGDADVAVGGFLVSPSNKVNGGQDIPTQAGWYAMISDNIGWLEVGIGAVYQKRDDIVVSDPLRFTLLAGINFENDRWWLPDGLYIRHNSNGGSGPVNSGWDWVTLRWHVR